jgi:hypothetical protein
MSLQQPTPPLLLTKRLTTFLQSNLTPQLHTTLLITLSGKLLAHASPHPVSQLRTQCTVASSLWAIHTAATSSIPEALPSSPPQASSSVGSSAVPPSPSAKPLSITVQLSGGAIVIRKLRCGLLFVCIGPAASEHLLSGDLSGLESGTGATNGLTASGPGTGSSGGGITSGGQTTPSQPPDSPSEVDSVLSAGAATTASYTSVASVAAAGVVALRRYAEELARCLDDKLGSLKVPEDGVTME